jgi:WD40 repeat protein/DNA-binding SARP family transcriptional activator/energy-coupling factor transporter ATP-binding protein EcfA2
VGIAVLGPLTIQGERKNLARRDRVVLAALIVHPGEVVSAGVLADVLWGERPPASWQKVIQGCVVRLRKVLGNHSIETSTDGYCLTIPLDEIDIQRFERAVARAGVMLAAAEAERSALVLADALTLWRGKPLAEVENWDAARIEIARLEELRQLAEELYVEASLRSGAHESVLGKAKVMTAEAPLRERRWALLATAQYQSGHQGDALTTLRQLRTMLDDELGLDAGQEIDALEQAILRQDPSLVVTSALPEPSAICPYQGLKPYDVHDADVFFGRDAEVVVGVRKLAETSVLAVVGPSGCGKSSLVRAGVVATLRRDGIRVVAITPGVHPMATLAAALPGQGAPPPLLVDQCEEVFSLCEDVVERESFLTRLADHSAEAPLILSLRADRLADLSSHPIFARAVERGLHLLTAMSEADLRVAITEPARLASLVVEPGLVDLLVAEVAGQPGALPLMSHALAETWQRREGRTLTISGYHASGGIQGAVAQSAEEIYAQVGPGQQAMLRELLLRLVTPGPDGQPIRSRLPRRTVVTSAEADALMDLLVGSRLVTSDDGVVELAHEALARAWPRLRRWLEEDLEGQQILHHLTTVADSWNSLGRPESELYRGVRLAKALEWRENTTTPLTDIEDEFLAAGEHLSEAELRAAEDQNRYHVRVNRRLQGALITGAFLLIGALLAGFLAVGQADRADRQATAAQQAALVADAGRAGAKAVVQTDIDTSLLLAVAGVRLDTAPESRANLLAAVAKHPQLIRSIPTQRLDAYGLEVSADGRRVVLFDATGAVLLYDLANGDLLRAYRPSNPLPGASHLDFLGPIAFSSGDRELAVAMPPPTTEPVRFLDPMTLLPTAQRLPGFTKTPARATHISYSKDGNSLVAMIQYYGDGILNDFSRGAVFVWDVHPGRQPSLRMTLALPASAVRDVAISPAGDRVYTSNPVAVYEVPTGRQLFSLPDLAFIELDLSPDGRTLALAAEAGDVAGANFEDVLLVDAATGEVRQRMKRHTDQLLGVRFSHQGRLVVSMGTDQRAVVWEVASGRVLEEVQISEGDSLTAGFSPDDATLYTETADGALRSWDLTGRRRYIAQVKDAPGFVYGCRLVSTGGGAVYRGVGSAASFTDVATGRVARLSGAISDSWTNTCGSWHPSGQMFATADTEGFISTWQVRTGRLLARRKVAHSKVLDLDYSGGDGNRLVVGEESGLAVMLDSASLRPVSAPLQVGGSIAWVSASPDNRTAMVLTGGRHLSDRLDLPSTGWALIDLAQQKVVRRGTLPISNPQVLSFAPNGKHLAIGSGKGEVLVLDMASGTPVAAPQLVHQGWTNGLAYAADSSLLVTGGYDGSVSLFDGDTAALLGSVRTPNHQIVSADFSTDGHTVVMGTYDDGIYLWDTRLEHAIETACQMAGRDLTAAEWQQNFGARPYQKTCP